MVMAKSPPAQPQPPLPPSPVSGSRTSNILGPSNPLGPFRFKLEHASADIKCLGRFDSVFRVPLVLGHLDQSQMPVSTADLAPNVPRELIIDVLLRLPAKSVGKFSADNDGVSKKLTLLEDKLTGATIIGSCNGLVLVSKFKRRSPDTKYYLINPTTMELVGIPANPLAPWARRGGIAFGYFRSNDDYKIVMFFGSDKVNNDAYLDVFSLRSGTWRRIDVLCDRPADVKGVFLNGAVHWLGECDGSLIMSFDLSSEEFKPLPGPSSPPEDSFFDRIEVFGGCLAVVASRVILLKFR
ncbi:F-box/kelch-repeat protein At3g06240-like [Coffea eugenioides]|uniref:F-box/kelch-repeat protein At3g06240-like n=1 Tax=Coffea eugenioides TaxID=49369 RepID=UPI000F61148A|nr:F-box/kelch-repeat protein At3g06240-like [Coffea eugenioides]